jgi:hypothetical protein
MFFVFIILPATFVISAILIVTVDKTLTYLTDRKKFKKVHLNFFKGIKGDNAMLKFKTLQFKKKLNAYSDNISEVESVLKTVSNPNSFVNGALKDAYPGVNTPEVLAAVLKEQYIEKEKAQKEFISGVNKLLKDRFTKRTIEDVKSLQEIAEILNDTSYSTKEVTCTDNILIK